MDQYMRENKIEGIRATAVKVEPPQPVEEIIDEPKPKAVKKNKAASAVATEKAAAHH